MKPIKTLHRYKAQFLAKLHSYDVYLKAIFQLCIVSGLAAMVWFCGPMIAWGDFYPFGPIEKRMYVIIFLYLAWLLKFLLLDIDGSNPFQLNDSTTQKRMQALQNRFRGALQFLKKTTISRQGRATHLYQLPWYLLIGPPGAGKTSLLANSKVHFILQRQFQQQPAQTIPPSENCDWWVTRDVSIIDVPGNYLTLPAASKPQEEKSNAHPALWRFFLRLMKKKRGNHGINGIVIALPLPEIMKQGDPKKYHAHLRHLFTRLNELQKLFPKPIPCYLSITKCDLLTGFNEFFAEAANDEITQAWGITLPTLKAGERLTDVFTERFNSLIKKLNQQLLWRLHQERNPMARPYIKDFPLQVERLKEFTLDFIKRLAGTRFKLALQGVYLTSALQTRTEKEPNIIEATDTAERAVQLFKEPISASRAYFIKQFISHGLAATHEDHSHPIASNPWKRRTAYAASVGIIATAAVMFGKDFEQGVRQAYSIQNRLSDYRIVMQQTHDPEIQLEKTLVLLNELQKTGNNPGYKLDLLHLLTFYSHKSQQKSNEVYQHALRAILLPEIRTYLTEYLKNPVNKNAEYIYTALKAYLMLGDTSHYQPEFVANTLRGILPKSFSKTQSNDFSSHLNLALKSAWAPMDLNQELIQQTRSYLNAIPSFQLGYIILKNIDNNNLDKEINLGTSAKENPTFTSAQTSNQVPAMFTANAFSTIANQETLVAAQEATAGNWVLGNDISLGKTADSTASLVDQLRNTYVSNYVDTWENLLSNIHLNTPTNLAETDAMINHLIGSHSPLLQLLQTLHENTYFEPITTASPKLQNLGLLVDKNNESSNTLYQIFSALQSLHQYINTVINAEDAKKAAFAAVSTRMHASETPDAITQLRLIADKSPEPIKGWLEKISNDAWRFMLHDASRYLDTSWHNQVGRFYQTDIANRYPFSATATQEVDLDKFTEFFGKPGIVMNFYNNYLVSFIDTSTPEWHWKTIDNMPLPIADGVLKQLRAAMQIHRMFFPNGDNKLFVQFALQPYFMSKQIKSVKLNINDKKIVDEKVDSHSPHLISWPSNTDSRLTQLQLVMANKVVSKRDFPGDWGWFKLVNQSFVETVSQKSILVNFSENSYPAKYLVFTEGKHNPFLATNLQGFTLPSQLMQQKG